MPNEKDIAKLTVQVAKLEHDSQQLYDFLREHMKEEEAKFDKLYIELNNIKLTMAKWLGGGITLMIISDWVMRAGFLYA